MTIRFGIISIFMLMAATVTGALTVDGTITDYLSGKPIKSCLVIVDGYSPGAGIDSVKTDANGQYSFTNLTAGVYSMLVTHERYAQDTAFRAFSNDQSVPFVLFEKKHLLDSVPDTLYKENSPYLVRKAVWADSPVVVLPGVAIRFIQKGSLSFYGGISAIGTEDDSIVFEADLAAGDSLYHVNTRLGLDNYNRNASNNFSYCSFKRLETINGHEYRNITFKNCRFTEMQTVLMLQIHTGNNKLIFNENTISGCINGISDYHPYTDWGLTHDEMANYADLTNNHFQCSNLAACLTVSQSMHLEHNTLLGYSILYTDQHTGNDTVVNNIFSLLSIRGQTDEKFFLAYNAIDSVFNILPTGVGAPALTNVNGDSCDFFYNVFADPYIADSTTGLLFAGSSCIGAASDGTNMGVFQGETAGVRQKLTGNVVRRTSRTLRAVFGDRSMVVRIDASAAPGEGVYTLSLYSLTGCQLWTNIKMLMTDDHLAPIGSDAPVPPSFAPGTYVARLSGGRKEHFFPAQLR